MEPPAAPAPVHPQGWLWAPIKKEFVLTKRKREDPSPAASTEPVALSSADDAAAPPATGILAEPKQPAQLKKKSKKQIKKERNERIKLCDTLVAQGSCPYGNGCKFSHDVTDLLPICPLFEKYGKCPTGLKCKFGGHIVDSKNIEKETVVPRVLSVNYLSKDLQSALWKETREFPRSEPVIQEWRALQKAPPKPAPAAAGESDLSMKAHPREIKKLELKGKLILAPLTTIGNLPYRVICKNLGADVTVGEMAVATNLLQGHRSEWALTRRDPCEDVFGIQIAGAHVDSMTRCAELLNDEVSFDFLDINCGCPIDIVYNKGMGSAMLERVARLEGVARGIHSVLDKPMTIKIRVGRDEKNPTVHKNIVPYVHLWGASALTIHGRSREQRYSKEADWNYIAKCVPIAQVPVIGNGDLYSWREAEDHFANTGVAGLMLARGAIIKPWLFTEIKEKRDWDISANERLDIVKKFCHLGLDHWGSDDYGVENTRTFLLNWMSFLHRYIPVGLLERLPSKINDRPPLFCGRSELETLLASPEIKDWVKISEMFLGKVSENFSFTPKHKSQTYKDDSAASAYEAEVEG